MNIVKLNTVKVIHGTNEDDFQIEGATVATVQVNLSDAFNIPAEAFAWVNGNIVDEDFRLLSGDILEFIVPIGLKGANDNGPDGHSFKTPFPYFGGKAKVAPEVWKRFGDVTNYVEPFFGGGGVLLNRPFTAGVNRKETVNDIDSLLANFWRAVKFHPRKLADIADYPVSEVDLHARHTWLVAKREEIAEQMRRNVKWCDPKVAAWWVWGISQWIGGGWCEGANQSRKMPHQHGRGVHRLNHQRQNAEHQNGDTSRRNLLDGYYRSLSKRLKRVRILNGDWSRLVTPSITTRYGLTGVFLDPPYTEISGRQARLYAMDDLSVGHQVQKWAVENGNNPLLRIALCGYEGEYKMPPNWSVFEWKGGGSRNGHKERIWFSPHCLPSQTL